MACKYNYKYLTFKNTRSLIKDDDVFSGVYNKLRTVFCDDKCVICLGIKHLNAYNINIDLYIEKGHFDIEFLRKAIADYKGQRCLITFLKNNKRVRFLAGALGFRQKSKSKNMFLYIKDL